MRLSLRHLAACVAASALAVVGCSGSPQPTARANTGKTTNATVASQRALPEPPGKLVDVNGHRMHLYCTGQGEPTVLFEAGFGDLSLTFSWVQEKLSATTRVCSYDRAGLGWSEPTPGPRTGAQMVTELEALLKAADEPGPYVLAGHSMGGLLALLFAEQNPDDVVGVVLIDSSHPAQDEKFASLPMVKAMEEASMAEVEAFAARAEAGDLEPWDVPISTDLPMEAKEQIAALSVQPHIWQTLIAENNAYPQTLKQARDAGSLGDTPLIVLAAGRGLEAQLSFQDRQRFGVTPDDIKRYDTIWRRLQKDHLTRSTNSRLIVAEDSTHYIHQDEPELVTQAIQSLLEP